MSNTPGNEFKNWDAPAGHDPKKNWNKVQNVPTSGGLKLSLDVKPF
jgi:hypothetical protein|tara:strand:- start:2827 stop:2964 length:138 start_codon:yes stop_codon:yes gene_type:complete